MTRFFRLTVFIFASLATSTSLSAGEIYNELPTQIDPSDKFVFYSHGYIVEGENPKPVESRNGWGVYDFPAVKEALSDDQYNLIATHRAKDTDPFRYATELSVQIRSLIEKGVQPEQIAIVGFSRGAFITGLTSDKVSDLEVNTVILAGCGRLVSKNHTDIKVYGHVLSIYENSDRANTCEKLKDKSQQVKSFTEIEINTGLEHGAFYRPIPQWVSPLKDWLRDKMKLAKQDSQ